MNVGQRLKEARTNLNLTLDLAGERSQIAASAISEFENAKREPKLAQLKKLADVYHCSIASLLDEKPIQKLAVLWRQKPESSAAEELQATLIDLATRFHSLEVLCEQKTTIDLPFVPPTSESFGYPEATSLARRVRAELGLGDRPGQTLLRVLEEVSSVKIFHIAFEPTGCAACSLSDQFGAAVLLNSNNARWRRNFDLAHELFHLLTWKQFSHHEQSGVSIATDQEEKLATCFARNLLMPEEVFREAVSIESKNDGKLNFDGLFEVAREFDVSIEAVLRQMSFVFNIDKELINKHVESLKLSIGKWDTRTSEPVPARPTRFVTLCNQAIRKGLISTGRYAESLGISRRDAMKLVEQEAIQDVEIEIAHS